MYYEPEMHGLGLGHNAKVFGLGKECQIIGLGLGFCLVLDFEISRPRTSSRICNLYLISLNFLVEKRYLLNYVTYK